MGYVIPAGSEFGIPTAFPYRGRFVIITARYGGIPPILEVAVHDLPWVQPIHSKPLVRP